MHSLVSAAAAPSTPNRLALLSCPLSHFTYHACQALVSPSSPELVFPDFFCFSFYCIILLSTLFISSCYWQPFPTDTPLSTPWSENISTFTDAINATLPPNLPRPAVIRAADRCWCDFTNGAFFEPFNVSHWEFLSVQRLKDSLEKKHKPSEEPLQEHLRELPDPLGGLNSIHNPGNSTLFSVWSTLKMLSSSIYRPFSNYMESDEVMPSEPSSLPETSHSEGIPLDADIKPLPLIRKEYDLERYGFNILLDFSWS